MDFKKSFILSELIVSWAVLSKRKGKCKVGAMKQGRVAEKLHSFLTFALLPIKKLRVHIEYVVLLFSEPVQTLQM